MKWLDLTHTKLYELRSAIDLDGEHLDLHNDFSVLRTEYSPVDHYLALHLESARTYCVLVFRKCVVTGLELLSLRSGSAEVGFEYVQKVLGVEDSLGYWLQLPGDQPF